jgi:hypothetical protein
MTDHAATLAGRIARFANGEVTEFRSAVGTS